MPIFAKGETKDKLTILFFAREADLDLTQEQLYRAMVENDCMSYFAFQTALTEMEEDGLIAAIPRTFGQGYRVSARGEETLAMFEESLPFSLRERLKAYAAQNRSELEKETQIVSSMRELPGGAYEVELRVQEKTTVAAEMRLRVISRAMAQRVRKGWHERAEELYIYLLSRLLEETPPPAPQAEEAPDAQAGAHTGAQA